MEEIDQLIGKFWAGALSELEKIRLYQYLDKQNEGIHKLLRAHLEKSFMCDQKEEPSSFNFMNDNKAERILTELHNHISIPGPTNNSRKKKDRIVYLTIWGALAACLIGIVFLFFLPNNIDYNTTQNNKIQPANPIAKTILNDSTIFNKSKFKKYVTLPDETQVVLNKYSSISFNKSLFETKKTIYLKGAAQFSVRHDPTRLFEVIAQNIKIQDIGTLFYVDAASEKQVSVQLLKGKVMIEPLKKSSIHFPPISMNAGENMVIDLYSQKYKVFTTDYNIRANKRSDIDTAETLTNKDILSNIYMVNPLNVTFSRESLHSVFHKIAILYHVTIHVKLNSSTEQLFTGTLSEGDALDKALDIICDLSGMAYTVGRNQKIQIITKN